MDEAGETTPTAGVVGEADGLVAALESAGFRTVAGDAPTVLAGEPSVVVAAGETALAAVASLDPVTPVLPVEAGRGVRSVPSAELDAALPRLAEGAWETDRHPLLGVDWAGRDPAHALLDTMLVTAEPAEISEFTVTADGERVARFRADGVVVATPAGTPGYARTAGGPVVTPGLPVFVVVPVAPFATSLDHWVVPAAETSVTVERDEAPVEVLADDRSLGVAPVGEPVRLRPTGRLDAVRVPEGRSPFGRAERELEKL